MNCTDFEREHIDRLAERSTELSDDARQHLAVCAECRSAWHTDRVLDSAIIAWRETVPVTHAGDRIVAALLEEQPRPVTVSTPSSAAMTWSVLVALTVLCALGLGLWRTPDSPSVIAKSEPSTELPLTESVASLWDGVQVQSQQAARETVKRLEEWPQVAVLSEPLPPSAPATDMESVEPPPTAEPQTWLPWSQPLGRQVGAAFRFLGDALPDPQAG